MMIRCVMAMLGLSTLVGCAGLERMGGIDPETARGLGFLGETNREGPQDVTADQVLPFGQIARNCTVNPPDVGTAIIDAADYTIYDTDTKSTGIRTQFITGFRDGCARQFSGALVIFGDVGTHELVRYADVGINDPYNVIDEAYEVIKATYCGAARTKPCGARIDRLAQSTTFVTVYESFADNASWADMLVHKGELVAKDVNR